MSEPTSPDAVNNKDGAEASFKGQYVKIGIAVALIGLFLLGIVGYISGFLLSEALFAVHIYGTILSYLLALYCLFFLARRAICLRRTGTRWSDRRLKFVSCMLLLIMCILVSCFVALPPPGYVPGYGFRNRIQGDADIAAIRLWLDEQKTINGLKMGPLEKSDWPKCIKHLSPSYVLLGQDAEGLMAQLHWAFGFGAQLIVGPETMEVRPSHNTLILGPGVYVWQGEK